MRIRKVKFIEKTACVFNSPEGAIQYILSRSNSRRTLSISINHLADVKVSAPLSAPQEKINSFINEKFNWIIHNVEKLKKQSVVILKKKYDHGHEFLFLGKNYPIIIHFHELKRSKIDFIVDKGWNIGIKAIPEERIKQKIIKNQLINWYRLQAQEILGGRLFQLARHVGVEPQKISIRTQKRLWGCCHYRKQAIFLNWQIILAPMEVIDYVIVHELCHLIHPNHSKRFWKKVQSVMPDYKQRQDWLKKHHIDMVLP